MTKLQYEQQCLRILKMFVEQDPSKEEITEIAEIAERNGYRKMHKFLSSAARRKI